MDGKIKGGDPYGSPHLVLN